MYIYSKYNREERNLCSHLFRLLLMDAPNYEPLKMFIGDDDLTNPRIFSEVALLRDAYFVRKPDINDFLDKLCMLVAKQENLEKIIKYSSLPSELRTHPRQIRAKAKKKNIILSVDDNILYLRIQNMFNAKPDLVICYNNTLIIYEAKYTLGFNKTQLERTGKMGKIWKELLYKDLGFDKKPKLQIRKLGLEKYKPDISWPKVKEIASEYLPENDLSLEAFINAVENNI